MLNISNDFSLILEIGSKFGIEANKFILDHLEKCEIDIHQIKSSTGQSYTDCIISKNEVVLRYILSRGIIPKNNISKIYIPCPECYNGEPHDCNFRFVTTNFLCLRKYKVSINDIKNSIFISENNVDFDSGENFLSFENSYNDDQIFDRPGISKLEIEDTDDEIKLNKYPWDYPYKFDSFEISPYILSYKKVRENPMAFGIDNY